MNKAVAKRMFAAGGLVVGKYVVMTPRDRRTAADIVRGIGLPAVMKPNAEGSSVGVTIVSKENEVGSAVDLAFSYGREIIVEQYLPGKEVQVGILGDRALGAIEIVPKDAFYSYKAKYEKGMSDHFFPARIPEQQYRVLLDAGLAAHRSLRCRGYSRVDFIVDGAGNPYILEVNTLPGMTGTSLVPQAALAAGMDFPELCERIALDAVRAKGGG